jgi:hypothetical protein
MAPGLQVFAKDFQRNAVPAPRISKQCFGGFVGFQWLTIDPNPFFAFPNFCRWRRPREAGRRGPQGQANETVFGLSMSQSIA